MAGSPNVPAKARSCNGCDLCCRVYDIPELAKPMGTPCSLLQASGCGVHGAHPKTCKAFRCHWLSQRELGEEWRPSTAGFVLRLDGDGTTLWIDTDPRRPEAWRALPYYGQIKSWSWAVKDGTGVVLVHDIPGVFVVFPETELLIADAPRGARFLAGYRPGLTGPRPWAEVIEDVVHSAAA